MVMLNWGLAWAYSSMVWNDHEQVSKCCKELFNSTNINRSLFLFKNNS